MQDYVSAQTYAMRSAGNGRFGFAWSPRNLAGIPSGDFTAQTDALLVRLAAAIADSARSPGGRLRLDLVQPRLDGAGDDRLAHLRNVEAIRPRVHDARANAVARARRRRR